MTKTKRVSQSIKNIDPKRALVAAEAVGTLLSLLPQTRLPVRIASAAIALTAKLLQESLKTRYSSTEVIYVEASSGKVPQKNTAEGTTDE